MGDYGKLHYAPRRLANLTDRGQLVRPNPESHSTARHAVLALLEILDQNRTSAIFSAVMRATLPDAKLFITNRDRLRKLLLPNSLAVLNANDIPLTNADSTNALPPNSDLFYLTGVEQDQSILLIFPDADDEKHLEILFLREPTAQTELCEGHKLAKEQVRKITGIRNIQWLSEFPSLFHRLMCECEHACLNSNEHKRAVVEVETREARFVAETQRRYPLHDYQRLARLSHRLRIVKSGPELEPIRNACAITEKGFR